MSAHNPPTNRRTERTATEHHVDNRYVSTRILLDSGTQPTCDACGDSIELKARHKCLTVRSEGGVEEYLFCDDGCLAGQAEPR